LNGTRLFVELKIVNQPIKMKCCDYKYEEKIISVRLKLYINSTALDNYV